MSCKAQTQQDATASLAAHLPSGLAWDAKNIEVSVLREVLHGMAAPFQLVQEILADLCKELNLNTTEALISAWETSVGLPDKCLPSDLTIDERRAAVALRLSKKPLVTLADLQGFLNSLFPNDVIMLSSGADVFSGFECEFEGTFFSADERFVLYVEIQCQNRTGFIYDFEFSFEDDDCRNSISCILNKIVPANVYIYFEDVI